MGDECGRKIDEREIVAGFDFPSDQERAEPIVPAVRALDHPAARRATHPPEERRLAFLPNVGDDAPIPDRPIAVAKRIPFVEATMLRPSHAATGFEHHGVEGPDQRPFVVEIRAA